jgi:hypothetical protein
VGAIARFEVIAPSSALRVDVVGDPPGAKTLKKLKSAVGTAVTFNTTAEAVCAPNKQIDDRRLTVSVPSTGAPLPEERVSRVRQVETL